MEYLVLSARRFDFRDKESGRRIEGVTVTYTDAGLEPLAEQKGLTLLQVGGSVDLWPELRPEPGFYRLDFRQVPGPKGKAALQLCGAQFVRPFSVDGAAA